MKLLSLIQMLNTAGKLINYSTWYQFKVTGERGELDICNVLSPLKRKRKKECTNVIQQDGGNVKPGGNGSVSLK